MQSLLETHLGYPLSTAFKTGSTHMHSLKEGSEDNILHGCYWLPTIHFTPELQLQLEPSPLAHVGITKPIKLWARHPTKPLVAIPKFFGLSAFGRGQDKRTLGAECKFEFLDVEFRPEQHIGIKLYLESMLAWGGGFFVADCGFGKTICMAKIIHCLGRKAMVVAPTLTLVTQLQNELLKFLPNAKVAVLQGACTPAKLKKLDDATLIIASLCSLAQCVYPPTFWSTVGTVLFDEAHLMCARTLCAILPHIPARYLGGFSATPSRRDNLEYVLYWLLGPTAFVYQRIPSITGKTGTVIVHKVSGPKLLTPFTFQKASVFTQLLAQVAANEERNSLILHLVVQQAAVRKRILILSAFREHAQTLAKQIEDAGIKVILLLGGAKKTEDTTYKCAVATYSLLELGYDDKTLDTLILCTPKSNIQQTVGRIEREHPGKLIPIVYDIVDKNQLLQGMWKKRKAFYQSRGFLLKEV
jgi:superfamily II DNA or RNA helicase